MLCADPPLRVDAAVLAQESGLLTSEPLPHLTAERVLALVLPPREWKEADGTVWRQAVSNLLPTREHVAALEGKLEHSLSELKARSAPLCPVREHLFSSAFDEVLRQVTLECPERGLLLLRVRDELRMTLAAYKTVASFQTGKTVREAPGVAALEQEFKALCDVRTALLEDVCQLEAHLLSVEKLSDTARVTAQSQRAELVKRLTDQNAVLHAFLDDCGGKPSDPTAAAPIPTPN